MPIADGNPRGNHILRSLTAEQYARLEGHLHLSTMAGRDLAYAANDRITTVYFPISGVLSLVTSLTSGESLAVAMIGREGFVGHAVALGGDRMPYDVVCKLASSSAAIRADILREHVRADPTLAALLLRSTAALFDQVALVATCNRLHPVEQRLARCLLMMHDRTGLAEFPMTHEFLAEMLGVRRATITEAAIALQQAGLIRHARGRVAIADRAGLEAVACECYQAMRGHRGPERLAA